MSRRPSLRDRATTNTRKTTSTTNTTDTTARPHYEFDAAGARVMVAGPKAPKGQKQKKTLQELNTEGIAGTPPKASKKRKQAPAADPDHLRGRLGLRIPPGEWAVARSAYLADWNAGGEHDTFRRWLAAILDDYLAHPTSVDLPEVHARWETQTFAIPRPTLQRLQAYVAQQQSAGTMTSQNDIARRALSAAVIRARAASGGDLAPVVGRLPSRLKRS